MRDREGGAAVRSAFLTVLVLFSGLISEADANTFHRDTCDVDSMIESSPVVVIAEAVADESRQGDVFETRLRPRLVMRGPKPPATMILSFDGKTTRPFVGEGFLTAGSIVVAFVTNQDSGRSYRAVDPCGLVRVSAKVPDARTDRSVRKMFEDLLVASARSSDRNAVAIAAAALAELRSPSTLSTLIELSDHDDWKVVAFALAGRIILGDREASDHAVELIEEHGMDKAPGRPGIEHRELFYLAFLISKCCPAPEAVTLNRWLEVAENRTLRRAVAYALRSCADEASAKVLVDCLHRDDSHAQLACLNALHRLVGQPKVAAEDYRENKETVRAHWRVWLERRE